MSDEPANRNSTCSAPEVCIDPTYKSPSINRLCLLCPSPYYTPASCFPTSSWPCTQCRHLLVYYMALPADKFLIVGGWIHKVKTPSQSFTSSRSGPVPKALLDPSIGCSGLQTSRASNGRPTKPSVLLLFFFLLNVVALLLVCIPIHFACVIPKRRTQIFLTRCDSVLEMFSAPFTDVPYFLQSPTAGGLTGIWTRWVAANASW
jgi:hypothetical protein